MFRVLLCIGMKHDWRLVAAAAVVCALGSAATMFLLSRAPQLPPWRRRAWLMMTGVVVGSTTFTTHFVAMLAFRTGLPVAFDPVETWLSFLVAFVGSSLLLWLGADGGRRRAASAGALLGGVIGAMHYLGMAGLRTEGRVIWDPAFVLASIALGAACGAGALALARRGAGFGRLAAATALMILAIAGLHFTGMTAATVLPDPRVAIPSSAFSGRTMALISVVCTSLIAVIAVVGAALDAASRYGALRRLREALDATTDGLAFFDPSGRLVAWNAAYANLREQRGMRLYAGLPLDELLSRALSAGCYPDAAGREDAWLAERRGLADTGESIVLRTPDGRWTRVTERRTADGGMVSSCVDITELKAAESGLIAARDKAAELARRAEAAEAVAGLGHWRLDVATRRVAWSPELYRIYGFAPDAPLDLDAVLAMTHPDDAAATNERLARQMRTGEADTGSISRIVSAKGETRYLSSRSAGEFADGAVVAVIGAIVDVTDRVVAERALLDSETRFRRLAVHAPAVMAESRLDGTMTYVSPASLAITGYTPEELVGRQFDFWTPPQDAERIRQMCETVLASRGGMAPWPIAFRARHKSGEMRWFECEPTPMHDATGRVVGFSDIIRDVSARKALDAQMQAARLEAEDAARVKSEFLANMSHELRTPLTSIIGFTGLVADQPDVPPLARTYIERVQEASNALLCTVNDILDFSKLEAGQVSIHPAPIDIGALCRSTLKLFAPQAGAKDLRLVYVGDAADGRVVLLDADRIRQVLLNFISNAVKFTQAGSVTLRVRYESATETLAVDVIDSGQGIPAAKLGDLFKRFSQVDGSSTRAAGGTGLGLAICKGLIEAMGGQVGVESREGEGSRFWFELLAVPALLPDEAQEAAVAGVAEGLRVLVADDHPTNRELVRLYLSGVGGEVTEAADGPEALELAGGEPFHVILLDLRMPGMGGGEVLQRLRAGSGPNHMTPVLAYTADAGDAALAAFRAQGFFDVVGKPVKPAELIAAVARATMFEPYLPAATSFEPA